MVNWIINYGDSGLPDTGMCEVTADTEKEALVQFTIKFNIPFEGSSDDITRGQLVRLIERDGFILGDIERN